MGGSSIGVGGIGIGVGPVAGGGGMTLWMRRGGGGVLLRIEGDNDFTCVIKRGVRIRGEGVEVSDAGNVGVRVGDGTAVTDVGD